MNNDDECDLFEAKGSKKKDDSTTKNGSSKNQKFLLIGGGFILISFAGAGGYWLSQNYHSSQTPIVIHPVHQPLKVKPDLTIEVIDEIEEDDEKPASVNQEAPRVRKKQRQNVIYDKIEKKRQQQKSKSSASASVSTREDQEPKSCGISYYVCFGHFDNHYDASVAWQKIKGDRFDDLKDVEPIIRVVASNDGKCYQLLAGPVSKALGLKMSKEFKTTLLSVDS